MPVALINEETKSNVKREEEDILSSAGMLHALTLK